MTDSPEQEAIFDALQLVIGTAGALDKFNARTSAKRGSEWYRKKDHTDDEWGELLNYVTGVEDAVAELHATQARIAQERREREPPPMPPPPPPGARPF